MSERSAFTRIPVVDIHGLFSERLEDRQAVADALGELGIDVQARSMASA